MEKEQLKELFEKYHEGICTEEEKALLEDWYLQFNEHEIEISPRKIHAIGNRIYRELPGNHSSFIKIGVTLAAAAVLIGFVFTIVLKMVTPPLPTPITKVSEVQPGKNKAILTLSNGHKVSLEEAANGEISNESGSKIVKTQDGQLVYFAESTGGDLNYSINTISTPNGGQWQVILPDGSKVWLNSASSLDYPATFKNQNERVVVVRGEAYFEVAKDKQHPFMVKTRGQTVSVLGTHFNINSYNDEPTVKTTLQEGKIKIQSLGGSKILTPGQQATLTDNSLSVEQADLAETLAWKNGYFRFNNEDIRSIMRKLARWYNIEVAYLYDIPNDSLNGKISRSKNIDQVLKALEATKTVHFKMEGRRVMVMK